VGVAVDGRRRTVGSPSGVSDTGVGIKNLLQVDVGLVNKLFELSDLADLLECKHLLLLVAIDS
jgi:hypothetical protein